MAAHRLDPLVRPRSIAVVGASARAGSPGNEVLVNLRKGGYDGAVYAVNPSADAVLGYTAYASLSDLPQVPQHVVFTVSDRRLEACLEEAIVLGVEAATVFSALYLDDDTDPPLRQRVQDKAAAAGLLLHGGNCMGFFNITDGAWVSGFDTRAHRPGGGVVLLSQSGAGMSGILDCEERLDFSFAASTGQELGVAIEDYLDFVLEQPQTRVIGLFLETTRHPQRLVAALHKACHRRIPVVAIKVGRSELAARLAVSHSGALAGSDASYQAVFEQHGVQRVDDMAQLAAALMMFAQPRRPAAGGLVTLHDSGGQRQLAIDLAQQLQVPFAVLGKATTARLQGMLDADLPAINPLDAWGSGGADAPAHMRDCFTALVQDSAAALGAVVHDRAPGGGIYPGYLDYLRAAQEAADKPVFLVANHGGSGSDPLVLQAGREGLPVIDGLREFLTGVRCMLSYRDFLAADTGAFPDPPPERVVASWRARLQRGEVDSEFAAGEMLRDFGIPVVTAVEVNSESDLAACVDRLSFPLVLKTSAPGIDHKSDVNGVVLNIGDESSLREAYTEMSGRLGPRALIAPMVAGQGVEMIVGISRDEQFGPMVLLGIGGVYTEALGDAVVMCPPFTAAQAKSALQRLQLAELLGAFRGRPALALDRFCEVAARVSQMALALADCVREVDINPMRLTTDGCIALDALIVPPERIKERGD